MIKSKSVKDDRRLSLVDEEVEFKFNQNNKLDEQKAPSGSNSEINESEEVQSSEQDDSDEESEEQCCSKATVLLADDLVFNMIPLEQILNNTYGLTCDKAKDGKEELDMYIANMTKKCCNARYRIILTDINMPRMDGIEASEQIFIAQKTLRATNPKLPEVMIVAITAYDTQQTFDRCHKVGISKCLTKPVKPDMLSFIVDYHNKMSGVVDAEAVNDEFAGSPVPRLQSNKINII